MGDRRLSAPNSAVSTPPAVSRWQRAPRWAWWSVLGNAGLLGLLAWTLWQTTPPPARGPATPSAAQPPTASTLTSPPPSPELGPRHQLSYEQWVGLLGREARAIAAQPPKRLNILLGDSLSLWFPTELLPTETTWLNQGISGETSGGLLNRLDLMDQTKPEVIFVMIGINDLIRGVSNEAIAANYRGMIRYLVWAHPDSRIVVQSVLPHSGPKATWEGRDRLLAIPLEQIQNLNESLAAIALDEGAQYLNLYPLFADETGYLHPDFTTDGLHLNRNGYLVWRSALQLYSQIKP